MAVVPTPASRPRRRPAERLAAWLVTGPLGHLYSVVGDLTVYFVRSIARRTWRRMARAMELSEPLENAGDRLERVVGRLRRDSGDPPGPVD